MVKINNMYISPKHPIKINNSWIYPKEYSNIVYVPCSEVYNLVLD